jgi:hypothetical protein
MSTIATTSFGERVAYSQTDLQNDGSIFSQTASIGGFVMATVGQPSFTDNYLGTLEGFTTDSAGNTTSFVYATGLAYTYTMPQGKKGARTINVPMPGSFTMPVRKGETWNLRLTWNAAVGPAPQVEFYWIPEQAESRPGAAANGPASKMKQSMEQLRSELSSGKIQTTMQLSAQQAIDGRVNDLAHILGDSVNASGGEQERQQFVAKLQKIVCSAAPAEAKSDNAVDPHALQELIASFSSLSGHSFSTQQNDLLETGVRALVQINDNESTRQDLSLISRNISLFIDNVQLVLQKQFGNHERRLLTRALMRLVGNGN